MCSSHVLNHLLFFPPYSHDNFVVCKMASSDYYYNNQFDRPDNFWKLRKFKIENSEIFDLWCLYQHVCKWHEYTNSLQIIMITVNVTATHMTCVSYSKCVYSMCASAPVFSSSFVLVFFFTKKKKRVVIFGHEYVINKYYTI